MNLTRNQIEMPDSWRDPLDTAPEKPKFPRAVAIAVAEELEPILSPLCTRGGDGKGGRHTIPCQSEEAVFRAVGMTPLAELKKPERRLRKDGSEKRKDGTLVSNPCRMGPLTFEARRWALSRVKDIQARAGVDLINPDEEAKINELIAAQTWPRGWDGTEPLATIPFANVNPDGSVQHIMRALLQ